MSVVYYFDELLFTTEEAAFDYAAESLPDCGIEDSVAELVDDHLLGVDELVVHS